jgi:capreomycidine synthase
MEIATALLEDWLRYNYFTCEFDIGCSGVENFTLGELRKLIGITADEMDGVIFNDSPSWGSMRLRRAIAKRWGNGDPERVMAAHGSSEVIFLIMNALLRSGDEVVVLDPYYHALGNIAQSIGSDLTKWPLQFEQQFVADIGAVKKLINPNTRMVVVNFPHNPTGASITPEQQAELIGAAADVGAFLVWDAAFAELTYNEPPLPDPGFRYDRAISMGTLSKAFGLPGLRVGWCLASPDLLARFVHLRDYTTLYLSPLVELIACRAIEKADKLINIRLEQARLNLDLLADWVGQHIEFVTWVRPRGGVTAFLRVHAVLDVEGFCRELLQECGVLLVPGTCFHCPGYVRLGFGGPTAELKEALSRLSSFLHSKRSAARMRVPSYG